MADFGLKKGYNELKNCWIYTFLSIANRRRAFHLQKKLQPRQGEILAALSDL